jgi:SAM-dependent methyltransferase/uncharacterized protein YbaR (Trm112 family)
MYEDVVEHLVCPACESDLEITTEIQTEVTETQTDLIEGFIRCVPGDHRYPVVDGVAILVEDLPEYLSEKSDALPEIVGAANDNRMKAFFAEQFADITELETGDYYTKFWEMYIWIHYRDINTSDSLLPEAFGDSDTAKAFTPQLLLETIESFVADCDASLGVDIGCATGGNTHTIAESADLALGCDKSFMMIRAAREIRDCDGTYEYEAPLDGNLTETRAVSVDPPAPERTEFLVADATALPLPDETADIALSMNLIDVVSKPENHLYEVNDVLAPGGRFVICDPYAWHRATAADSKDWRDRRRTLRTGAPESPN